jgi:hypothetical protein
VFQRTGVTQRSSGDGAVEAYLRARDGLQAELVGSREPVRLAKKTSNLFRPRERGGRPSTSRPSPACSRWTPSAARPTCSA